MQVNLLISKQNLRTAVFDSSAECSEQFPLFEVRSGPEIDQLDVEGFRHDDVFVLDVAVDDVLSVQVHHSSHNLRRANGEQNVTCYLFTDSHSGRHYSGHTLV